MAYNFYNLLTGVKNEKNNNEKFITYIEPILILKLIGGMNSLSQKLFNLKDDDKVSFVLDFFDFSVRANAIICASANDILKSKDKNSEKAADVMFKFGHNIRQLGITVVAHNREMFEQNSYKLFNKYYLEFNKETVIEKSLNNLPHVYVSWFNVSNFYLINSNKFKKEHTDKLMADVNLVNEFIPLIIGYLFGVVEKNNYRWEKFIDLHLRKYWDLIDEKHKAR